MLCDYGCGQEAKYQLKNGKWCCSKNTSLCKVVRRKISENNSMYRTEVRIKKSKSSKGQCVGELNPAKRPEVRKRISVSRTGKLVGKENPFFGKHHSEQHKRKMSELMKNGGAAWASKFIKNPSREELKLREIVKELYPQSQHTYQILNYLIDVAILELKIAIEFDGWRHFSCDKNIEYHNKRQKEIEEQRWKFVRYNIFQKFPTKEQVREDIIKLADSSNGRTGE